MAKGQSRMPRMTIGEFERDVDELRGSTRQLGTALPALTRLLSSFLEDAAVSTYLYDEEDGEFVLRDSTQLPVPAGEAPRLRAPRTIPGLAAEEHRSVSLFEDKGAKAGRLCAEEHVFPLEAGGQTLGAVTVTHIGAEQLSRLRLDVARRGLQRFAAVLGKARSEERMVRQMSRLSAINEFGVVLVSSLAPEEVPALATAMTSFIIGAEGCILRLRDEVSTEFSVRDAHGLRDEVSGRKILELEKLAAQQVLASRSPLLVRNVGAEPAFRAWGDRVRTFICHPLADGSGAITVFNKDPEGPLASARFSQEDQDVLVHLVRYIEKAVGNAALFARNRKLAERDELTGLPDRASFQARLLTEISRARRFHLRIALVTCEVQAAPASGEEPAGEEAGQLIQRVAEAIRGAVRDYDTVARIAERTFGIILPQVHNGTESPVSRIREAIGREIERLQQSGRVPELQVRFSHMTFPDDGMDGAQMLGHLERSG